MPRPGAAPVVTVAKEAVEKTVACFAWGADTEGQIPPRYGYENTLAAIQEDNVDVAAFAESASEEPETSPTDSGISRSSAYCYTLVQSLADGIFKQESAPSPASDVVDVLDGDGVTLSGFEIPDMDGLTVTHIRLYRTASRNQNQRVPFSGRT